MAPTRLDLGRWPALPSDDPGRLQPGLPAGSAFNPSGRVGPVYAGQHTKNSSNPSSVSQYDVACCQVSQH